MRIKIFGSAGTGKTTSVSKMVRKLVEGYGYDKVYGLSLTRAAKWSLIKKLASGEKDVETLEKNILTLHSFAYRKFSEERKIHIASYKEIGDFFKEKGFDFVSESEVTEDFDSAFGFVDLSDYSGNRLYQLFTLIRLSLMYTEPPRIRKFIEQYREILPVSPHFFVRLLAEFSQWLKKEDIWDYTRLLTELYKREDIEMNGFILIIDEAQDIAPLNAAILNRYLDNFQYVIIAGDDDQCLFGFASATPDFMLYTPVDKEIVLPVSYRLPKRIWRVARSIIDQNKRRKFKNFKPRNEEGKVDYLYSYDEVIERILVHKNESIFILTRNNIFLKGWANLLEKLNIPYKIIGKRHTIPERLIKALEIIKRIKKGEPVLPEDAFWLLRYIKIGRIKGTKHAKIAKQIAAIHTRGYNSATPEGKVIKWLITTPVDRILAREDREVLRKWWKRMENIEEWKNPRIRLSTIHASKGLEAETVFLDIRITKRVYNEALKDIEPERRVAYVGVTRAKQNLYIVSPSFKALNYFTLGIL